MYVLATAGHVDHGKSTLVRALTGMDPDRWALERARGMTIDLGFAWLTLPGGDQLAFIDVPGHERFVANMLAGVAAAPAVLMVVAADAGWSRQSEEHLVAIDALGIERGLLVITRADLADPTPALAQAQARLARSSLGNVPAVAVSARTGLGMVQLLDTIEKVLTELPQPDADADIRFWIDRSFTIRGRGTVVTGTLMAGTISVDDELLLHKPSSAAVPVQVRGMQLLKNAHTTVSGVARVALNLRGPAADEIGRGCLLLSPQRWITSASVDVRLSAPVSARLPAHLMLHIGSAEVPIRLRPLGIDTARLTLDYPMPLRLQDRAVLRDPAQQMVVAGVRVLDVKPPELSRRGAARERAKELAEFGSPDLGSELRRRQFAPAGLLRAMGLPTAQFPEAGVSVSIGGDWLADPTWWAAKAEQLQRSVAEHSGANPQSPGMPVEQARLSLGLADRAMLEALARTCAGMRIENGLVYGQVRTASLSPGVQTALERLQQHLQAEPYLAPESAQLAAFGLDAATVATLTAAKHVIRVGPGIYLLPTAIEDAVDLLSKLEQPFSVSAARQALNTTRRVAVPLLELLDRQQRTVRQPDSLRRVRQRT